jgi:hypothetical protein
MLHQYFLRVRSASYRLAESLYNNFQSANIKASKKSLIQLRLMVWSRAVCYRPSEP